MRCIFSLRSLLLGAVLASLWCVPAWAQIVAPPMAFPLFQAPVDYSALTNHPVEVPNFMPEPFTGLVTDSDGALYAVNPYANFVVRDLVGQRLEIPTGLNPISLAIIEDRPNVGDRKLLVVCAGTHGLFTHDAITGAMEGFRLLESEPADIVYDDENELAFVTCQGTNAILQFDPLDLVTAPVRYQIPVGERPSFLYLDRRETGPADNKVYVVASVTGNNTITRDPTSEPNFGVLMSLAGHPGGELDDHDVYRIDPVARRITAAIRKVGSLLFDIARYPGNDGGRMWVLATESRNADPALPHEPALNGKFAVNRLQQVSGVFSTTLATAGVGVDLDDYLVRQPGAQYHSDHSINQARALAFLDGRGYIASPFSDLIIEVDAQGDRIRELQLPTAAQCYSILPVGNRIYALCLGTMTIEAFQVLPFVPPTPGTIPLLPALPNPISLGPDPTPDQIRRGRGVFLDGKLSRDARFSCASCHPRGMADQLGWQLSDYPSDIKDVMVTQSLLSIADTFPHHWRGERDLLDFMGAFGGLLGAIDEGASGSGRAITADEMDDFVVFVNSLQAPANPHQHITRKVDNSAGGGPIHNGDIPPTPVDPFALATQGKVDYEVVPIPQDADATCADCHTVESGTDGNLFPVNQGQIPRGFSTVVTHFRQLQNKGRLGKVVAFDDGTGTLVDEVVPANGFGFGHEGRTVSLRHFIEGFEATVAPSTVANIFRFVDQFDQGIAPACHWAVWYDSASPPAVSNDISNLLIGGSNNEWLDIAVVGQARPPLGPLQPMRYWYDPSAQPNPAFVPEDPGFVTLDWPAMMAAVGVGDVQGVFLGLPPGSGKRFAIDYDGDGVLNAVDTSPYTHNATDDGMLPSVASVRVDHSTARMAKLVLEFSEDVTYSIDYWSDPLNGGALGPTHSIAREDFVRQDTIVLQHNQPRTPFVSLFQGDVPFFFAEINLVDRFGNPNGPIILEEVPGSGAPLFVPDPVFPESINGQGVLTGAGLQHVRRMEEAMTSPVPGPVPGSWTYTLEVDVRSNIGAPNFLSPWFPNLFPPGTFPPQVVFASVAHDLSGDFVKATLGTGTGQMTTPTSSFNFVDGSGVVSAYDSEPKMPWVVSGNLDAVGDTTITFTVYGLPTGTIVRVAIMGIVQEDPVLSSPGNPVYAGGSLQFFQLFDTQIGVANATHYDLIVP